MLSICALSKEIFSGIAGGSLVASARDSQRDHRARFSAA
jgi:hypothetical protein